MNHKLIKNHSSITLLRSVVHRNTTTTTSCQSLTSPLWLTHNQHQQHHLHSKLYSTGRSFVPSSSPEGEQQQQQQQSRSSSFQHRTTSSSSPISGYQRTSTSTPPNVESPASEPHFASKSGVKPSMRASGAAIGLGRLLITVGIITGLAYGAYSYYDENIKKLDKDYYRRVESGSSGGDSGGSGDAKNSAAVTSAGGQQQKKLSGFFTPKARTIRNQFIVTRTRVYEIEICRGDILDEKTDAIVCSVNSNLDMNKGDLAQMIADRVGDQYKRETREYASSHKGTINYGDVAVVKAGGDLRCRYVIQACSPTWEGGEKSEIFQLSQAVYNALAAADKLGLESISIPAVGTGSNRFPKEKCAQVIIDSVAAYFNDRDFTKGSARANRKCLNKVRLINADELAVDAFVKEFDHKKKMGKFLV